MVCGIMCVFFFLGWWLIYILKMFFPTMAMFYLSNKMRLYKINKCMLNEKMDG